MLTLWRLLSLRHWMVHMDLFKILFVVVQLLSPVLVFLQPHELQHASLPCPLLSPGVCSNSCPLSWWCHPTFSASVTPFSPCPQYFPASGSFPASWLFTSGGQIIGASASASVLPTFRVLISFRIDWFDLLPVQGTLKCILQHHSLKVSILWCSAFFMVWLSHPYMTTGKNHSFEYLGLCRQSDVSAF